ncbi:hypothetical protein Ancab_023684 [Ancistrocladus abbreviatus]
MAEGEPSLRAAMAVVHPPPATQCICSLLISLSEETTLIRSMQLKFPSEEGMDLESIGKDIINALKCKSLMASGPYWWQASRTKGRKFCFNSL